jgi:transcriptional repressor NrdR
MRCPYCSSDQLKVTDTRETSDDLAIRRRRECLDCRRRFTTFETIELQNLQVQKRDNRFQDFDFAKVKQGLEKACRHTRIGPEGIMKVALSIQNELLTSYQGSVTSTEIGDMVMDALRQVDSVAYIRFACEYRRFKDITELVATISAIESKDAINK